MHAELVEQVARCRSARRPPASFCRLAAPRASPVPGSRRTTRRPCRRTTARRRAPASRWTTCRTARYLGRRPSCTRLEEQSAAIGDGDGDWNNLPLLERHDDDGHWKNNLLLLERHHSDGDGGLDLARAAEAERPGIIMNDAVAVMEFQRQRPVLPPAERADHEKDVEGSPTPSELSTSSDLLDEHWFDSMDAGSYYATLAQGMLMEPPAARAWSEDGGESSGGDMPLWN